MDTKKVLSYSVGPLGSAILSLAVLPILAWMYSADDIGRYAIIHIIISLSFLLCSLGLEQAYVREYYEHGNRLSLLKTTSLIGVVATALAISSLLVFSRKMSLVFFDMPDAQLTYFVIACVSSNFFTSYSLLILRMSERAMAFSMITLSGKAIFLLLLFLFFLSAYERSFYSLILMHTISTVTMLIVAMWITRAEWIGAIRAKFLSNELRSLFAFSLPFIVGGICYWGLSSLDRVLLRSLSSFEQLGVFSVAASFAGAASILRTVFSTIWTPFIYKWNKDGIDTRQFNKITDTILILVILFYAFAGALAWLSRFLLPSHYENVAHIVSACMAVPLIYIISETTVVGTHISRKTLYTILAPIGGIIVALVLGFVLVPLFGAGGASSATCAAFFVYLLIRTECSIYLWQKFPRRKIYALSFICVALSITQAICFEILGDYFFVLWGIFAIFIILSYRASLIDVYRLAVK